MAAILIPDEDAARLTQIETDVNALRAELGLAPFTADEIIAGCVQVGLNALTNGRDVPNTGTRIPSLSVAGLPSTEDDVTIPAAIAARVTAIATILEVTETSLRSLAVHAGCLVMLAETENKGYVPSFS